MSLVDIPLLDRLWMSSLVKTFMGASVLGVGGIIVLL